MRVSVLAFARLREILGFARREVELTGGATLEALWLQLVAELPDAQALRAATRFACNGALVEGATALNDGDEVALMPPVGGG